MGDYLYGVCLMGDCVFVWSVFNGGLYLYGVCLMGDCVFVWSMFNGDCICMEYV